MARSPRRDRALRHRYPRADSLIREKGMPNAVIAHAPDGKFDVDALQKGSARMAGHRRHGPRAIGDERANVSPGTRPNGCSTKAMAGRTNPEFHVVAIDYGIKRNILRLLASAGCKVTVVPAKTSAEDIMALKPDGVFLVERSGRSGRDRQICRARHSPHHRRRTSRLSASASAIRCLGSRSAAEP